MINKQQTKKTGTTSWSQSVISYSTEQQQSPQSSPQFAPYTTCVSSPTYRSDLYSQSWLGRSNADSSETSPAGRWWTKSSPELCLPSPDRGFHALHHILDVRFVILISQQCCQDLGRWTLYESRTIVTSGLDILLLFFFFFFCCSMFSLGGEILSKLKIACRHLSSCVTSLMKAFLKHRFCCADLLNIYVP